MNYACRNLISDLHILCKDKVMGISGYIKLLLESEVLGQGGMRIAKKAEILEGCSHPFLEKFAIGSNVVTKEYTENVEKAVNEVERTLIHCKKGNVE